MSNNYFLEKMSPLYVECDITQRCNLRCIRCNRFCDITKNLNSDITYGEFKNILDQLQKYDINRFRIIGGEPTLHPQLIELCQELINRSNIKYIELLTNFTQRNIIQNIKNNFQKIKVLNLDGNSSKNIKYKKFLRHVNIYLSPKLEKKQIPNTPCNIYNNYYDESNCGMHIFKLNNEIKFMYSSVCSAVIRLLNLNNLFFRDVHELISSDQQKIYSQICQHCMMGSPEPILVKDNIKSSNIFLIPKS